MLCSLSNVIPVPDRPAYLSDLYDVIFGICDHRDEKNVISTVEYHKAEDLGKNHRLIGYIKTYTNNGVSELMSFTEYMKLTPHKMNAINLAMREKSEGLSKRNQAENKALSKELDGLIGNNRGES